MALLKHYLIQNKTTENVFFTIIMLLLVVCNAPAQNFTSGFNFNMPTDDSIVSPFFPKFIKKTITEVDRVTSQGESFMVAGKPYRFWGVSLVANACFPSKENAPKVALHMRKMGINLVRFTQMDNFWANQDGTIFNKGQNTRSLNAVSVDRLDYFVNELKKNNIYININLNVSRSFTTGDGISGADSLKDNGKGVTIFDPQMITLQKEYAQQLLTHINPYTNTSLATDPSVALIEMINQNSLYGMWKDDSLKHVSVRGNLLQRHITQLDNLWITFLTNKYSTQAQLKTAWAVSNSINPLNRLQNGDFEASTLGNHWQSELNNGALATFGIDTNEKKSGSQSAKTQITNSTGTDWHIQIQYVHLSFKKDSTYVIKFSAKADRNRPVKVNLMKNGEPYTSYGDKNFNLTTTWQTFQFVVRPSENLENSGRFSFSLGQSNGSVWLDDVSFFETLTTSLDDGENLDNNNVRRIAYYEKVLYSNQRVADLAEFYILLQKSFMEDMHSYLKNNLNVKSSITGTNALVGIQEGLEHELMDYYDEHSYWDYPWFPGTPWDINNWSIRNKPLVKEPDAIALTSAFNGIALADKPSTLSEYNQPFPNRYRVEMVHEMVAYGSFHGLDGLVFFEYSDKGEPLASKDYIPSFFNTARDPSVMALFPTCSYAFRNELIATAQKPVLVSYSRKDIFNSFQKDNINRWEKYVPYPLKTQLTHSIRTKTYNNPIDFTPSVLPTPSTNIFETDTKETVLNTTIGILTTKTPKFLAITGFMNNASNMSVGNLKLNNANDFGSLTWLSLNDKPLSDPDTTLLTLSSVAQNTGMVWNPTNTSISNNWGNEPTQVKPLEMSIRLNVPAFSVDLHTLAPTGQSLSVKNIRPSIAGLFDITLSQNTDKTLWYALVFKKTNPTKDIVEQDNFEVLPNPANNKLYIKYNINVEETTRIDMFDMTGKNVYYKKIENQLLGEKQEIIDASKLCSGIYLIKVGKKMKKVMITH